MTANLLNSTQLEPAVEALTAGDVVGIPTETVYGLAGNAFDPAAIAKIFSTKERPTFDPLIVHVPADWNCIRELAKHGIVDQDQISIQTGALAEALMKSFWPGPLTIILPRHKKIPDLVTSGLDSVGIRMPSHPVAQAILKATQCPLAAPSANRFGRISPTSAQHVMSELGDRISFVIDGGPCEVGIESTVVAIVDKNVKILRPGKISSSDIEKALQQFHAHISHVKSILDEKDQSPQNAPGQLASHYAPQKPLYRLESSATQFIERLLPFLRSRKVAVLYVRTDDETFVSRLRNFGVAVIDQCALSESGQGSEAAQNLFGAMRRLDGSRSDIIVCEPTPTEDGLWHAINDRLLRASHKL